MPVRHETGYPSLHNDKKQIRFLKKFPASRCYISIRFLILPSFLVPPKRQTHTHTPTYTLAYLMTFEIQTTYLLFGIDNGHEDRPHTHT